MESRELVNGEQLEIGDVVEITPTIGLPYTKTITRVTKTLALAKWTNSYEGKFPRVFLDYTFQVLPREKWRTTRYKVYRSVNGK